MFTEENEINIDTSITVSEDLVAQTETAVLEGSDSTLGIDMSKLDKKSMEILEDTDESDYKFQTS